MRQSANSAVRFSTYSSLKALVQGGTRPGDALPSGITFVIGGIAGIVTVYTTMPLESALHSLAFTEPTLSFACEQRHQDENAIFDSQGAIQKLFRLRCQDLQ